MLPQVLKEPKDVAQQRRDEEAAANAARRTAAFVKADERTKMKGKNKPTRRQKKKQMNIIEERKPVLRTKLQQEVQPKEWSIDAVLCVCVLLGSNTHQEARTVVPFKKAPVSACGSRRRPGNSWQTNGRCTVLGPAGCACIAMLDMGPSAAVCCIQRAASCAAAQSAGFRTFQGHVHVQSRTGHSLLALCCGRVCAAAGA
jgi:hypothetical protein